MVVESWLWSYQESGIKEQDSQVCVCVVGDCPLLSMLEARGLLLPTLNETCEDSLRHSCISPTEKYYGIYEGRKI